MTYDPRLKEAMRKILAICEEYDCGGYISLASENGGEFRYRFPKWTALIEDKDASGRTIGVRIKCKKEERKRAELTAHFIYSQRDIASQQFMTFDHLCSMTFPAWQTEYEPIANRIRPHRENEN